MRPEDSPRLLVDLVGQLVVVDLRSMYVCLGLLTGLDPAYLELRDADLHDFRDGNTTREIYVFKSARLGINPNRARVLIRRDEVVAITRLSDVAEA